MRIDKYRYKRLKEAVANKEKRLNPHIKKVTKERLEKALGSDPHRYSFLAGKYFVVRRFAFSTPAGELRAVYTIRK